MNTGKWGLLAISLAVVVSMAALLASTMVPNASHAAPPVTNATGGAKARRSDPPGESKGAPKGKEPVAQSPEPESALPNGEKSPDPSAQNNAISGGPANEPSSIVDALGDKKPEDEDNVPPEPGKLKTLQEQTASPEKSASTMPVASPDPTPWLLFVLMLVLAAGGFWWQRRSLSALAGRLERFDNAKAEMRSAINALKRELDNLHKIANSPMRTTAGTRPPYGDTGKTPPDPAAPRSLHTHEQPSQRRVQPFADDIGIGPLVDHETRRFQTPSESFDAAEAYSPPSREPALRDFLIELQEAAEAVLSDTGAADSADLTAQIAKRVSAGAALKLRNGWWKVGAHNGASDLSTDLSNPHFISAIARDGEGWLLPYPRGEYAFGFRKYYIGERSNWPSFSVAAKCRIDRDRKIQIVEKGAL